MALPVAFATILAAAVITGCGADEPESAASPAEYERALADAPPPLARLYSRPNELLSGGPKAFKRTLGALHGYPVVVNKWASWCGPCQAEFPVFQAATLEHGKEIGFIGLNSEDADPKARKFLDERPLPFPSYTDPQSKVAYARQIAAGFPMTMFIDRNGKTYTHTGPYTSEEQLSKDIERYLG
jgi:cytochrome c biogenesis protein CcmG, thiol:disulfide interchange protein DsbE